MHAVGRGGGRRGDQRRQAVDADDAGELGDRQDRHLAVAERHPGEAGEKEAAAQFGRRPHGRRDQQRAHAELTAGVADDHGEDRWEEREIENQQAGEDDGQDVREAAEDDHHVDQPVERAPEIRDAGDPAEEERAERARPLEAARDAAERDEQWEQGHPGERWMAELRETQRQEDAGQNR